jgi:hypothetical protein
MVQAFGSLAETLRSMSDPTTSQESEGLQSGVSGVPGGHSSGQNVGTSSGTSVTDSLQARDVVDLQLMDSLRNRINRSVPVEQQWAEVVVRTVQGERRVLDVCRVKAWDSPR